MKTKKTLALGAAVVALSMPAVQKAQAATATLNIDANIIAAIGITEGTALDFGDIAAGTAASTVTVAPDGGISDGGSNINTAGGHAAGQINVTAGANGVPITFSMAAATAALTGPGPNMVAGTFLFGDANNGCTAVADGATIACTFATAVGAHVNVGGTLAVADSATQTAGAYSGSVTVNANY